MEERTKLRYERQSRGWSQEKAAESIGVSRATVAAWEANKTMPHPSQLAKLCEIYGKTLWELGFYEDNGSRIPDEGVLPRGLESLCTDLEFRVQCIIYEALSRRMSLYELRRKLSNILALEEGSTTMDLERRKLLRHLALIPLQAFGLSVVGASRSYAPEDILIHCAAGITACEDLSKGIDLNLAYAAASAYIPALKSIAKNCPSQRKVASELIAQAMLLLAALALHVDGSKAAIVYAEQAVSYSEASGNLELVLTAQGQLAWIFSCDKQYRKALETARQAEHLLKMTKKDIHPLVRSNTYAVLGAYSAQNGRREEALTSLHMATQMFFTTAPSDDYSYMDYDYSEIATTWGLAHARTGHPQEALNSFAEVIDPETLIAKMAVSERARIELLNHMALASVKSPKRDMEQTLKFWQAGMQGAKTLQSEQRFSEASTTYEILDGVWPGDRRIGGLRELVAHW